MRQLKRVKHAKHMIVLALSFAMTAVTFLSLLVAVDLPMSVEIVRGFEDLDPGTRQFLPYIIIGIGSALPIFIIVVSRAIWRKWSNNRNRAA